MTKYNGFKKASEWIGKRVVAVRHIETRGGKAVTPGMRGTVMGAFGGLDIKFDVCRHCGTGMHIKNADYHSVMVVNEEPNDEA